MHSQTKKQPPKKVVDPEERKSSKQYKHKLRDLKEHDMEDNDEVFDRR